MKHLLQRGEFWSVRLGPVRTTPVGEWSFPTEKAARRFAKGSFTEQGRWAEVRNQYGNIIYRIRRV